MTKERPKAVLKKGEITKVSCFVGGCSHAIHDKCAGIPKSNQCAACRCKKNYVGVEG